MTGSVIMLTSHIEFLVTINVGDCNMVSLCDMVSVFYSAISLFTMSLCTPGNHHAVLLCYFSFVDQKALYWGYCCYHSCCIWGNQIREESDFLRVTDI